VARLGLQHRVWQSRVLDAWRRAGFGAGQRLADIGSGPGFAALDLAEIVGPVGHVFAIERSRRFLDVLDRERERRGLSQITTQLADLDWDGLPAGFDGAWCRWVLAFVKQPRTVVEKIAASLEPGGVFVAHEYLNYAAWRLLPGSPDFESFVADVIAAWRDDGGEPDIGIQLPAWLEHAGFALWNDRSVDLLKSLPASSGSSSIGRSINRSIARFNCDRALRIRSPRGGALRFDGILPAVIQWHDDRHPADALPDSGRQLLALSLTHPQSDDLRTLFARLGISATIDLNPGTPKIAARIRAPRTVRLLV
jgi:SAM-dependent methyltransferase